MEQAAEDEWTPIGTSGSRELSMWGGNHTPPNASSESMCDSFRVLMLIMQQLVRNSAANYVTEKATTAD